MGVKRVMESQPCELNAAQRQTQRLFWLNARRRAQRQAR
jgi:hypothetical protein